MFEGTKRHTKEDINKDLYAEENKMVCYRIHFVIIITSLRTT